MQKTLLKGLAVLELLAESERPRGVTELAAAMRLEKTNVHRLLKALASRGYVRKDPETGRYVCTLKLWEIGASIAERLDIRTLARPRLVRLAEETRETVHLSTLDRLEVIYIDKVDSPNPIREYSRVGGRAPAHCVATGKALLAFLPERDWRELRSVTLRSYTPTTITNWVRLERELAKIRRDGFTVNRGEWREGVNGIGAPVLSRDGAAVAAISITCPPITAAVIARLAPPVLAAASEISNALGYTARD